MNTTKNGMRALLASAAAGALVLGSAAGVATAKPATPKAPTVKLQSVSIKGHSPIDLAKVTADSKIALRAKTLGSKTEGATVAIKLGVYDKKVGGTLVPGSESTATTLAMKNTKPKKVAWFAEDATILSVWEADQIVVLAAKVKDNGKAYICISSAVTTPAVSKYSVKVQKRLGDKSPEDGVQPVKKAVRDCVKVVNSTVTPAP